MVRATCARWQHSCPRSRRVARLFVNILVPLLFSSSPCLHVSDNIFFVGYFADHGVESANSKRVSSSARIEVVAFSIDCMKIHDDASTRKFTLHLYTPLSQVFTMELNSHDRQWTDEGGNAPGPSETREMKQKTTQISMCKQKIQKLGKATTNLHYLFLHRSSSPVVSSIASVISSNTGIGAEFPYAAILMPDS